MERPSKSGWIAERELLYCLLGQEERKPLSIRIYAPFIVQPGTVNFDASGGVAGCEYELVGLPEKVSDTAYGADTLQALQLATSVENILRSLTKKYLLYFPTGEPYFDD